MKRFSWILALLLVIALGSMSSAAEPSVKPPLTGTTDVIINIGSFAELIVPEQFTIDLISYRYDDLHKSDPAPVTVRTNTKVKLTVEFDKNSWDFGTTNLSEKDLWGWDGDFNNWLISPNIICETTNGHLIGSGENHEGLSYVVDAGEQTYQLRAEARVNENSDWTRLLANEKISGKVIFTLSEL